MKLQKNHNVQICNFMFVFFGLVLLLLMLLGIKKILSKSYDFSVSI